MKPHGRKWRYEFRKWQPCEFGMRLYWYDYGLWGYRKRMKV